jgi:hypothetical protein
MKCISLRLDETSVLRTDIFPRTSSKTTANYLAKLRKRMGRYRSWSRQRDTCTSTYDDVSR